MNELSAKAKSLLDYCRDNGRFCPQPQEWNQIWEMLPQRTQKPSGGWIPALPLILGAWHYASGLDKLLRLREYIEWADKHDAIDEVDAFLRGLSESQWFHGSD